MSCLGKNVFERGQLWSLAGGDEFMLIIEARSRLSDGNQWARYFNDGAECDGYFALHGVDGLVADGIWKLLESV